MNDNPVGTPNPISSGPGKVEVNDTPATVQVETLSPDGRPMEQLAPPEPPKKSKKGLIIGLILGAFVLICGITTAVVLLLNNKKEDAVAVAMSRLLNSETPSNVAIDGTVDILFNNRKAPVRSLKVKLDSDIKAGSTINTSSAVLDIETWNNGTYSVEFNEVYASDSDLYFKLSGLTNALEGIDVTTLFQSGTEVVDCNATDVDCVSAGGVEVVECNSETENCTSTVEGSVLQTTNDGSVLLDTTETLDTTNVTNDSNASAIKEVLTNSVAEIVNAIDGKWLRISSSELQSITGATEESPATCVVDLVNDLNKNSNSTLKLYNEHPFVESTTEDVAIPSKDNPVYRVKINDKNFTGFVNGIDNPALKGDFYKCLGWEDKTAISVADVTEATGKMPAVYVEVNGNHEFSRIYLETDVNNSNATVTLDLNLSYPDRVNVSEPIEYTDFSNVIQEIMSSMYNVPEAENQGLPAGPVTE